MYIPKIITSLLFSICVLSVYAQRNFVPAIVIPVNGDTLHGYINDREWSKNPKKIEFRVSATSETIIYTPTAIKGFTILNGNRYVSYAGLLDSSVSDVSKLDYSPILRQRRDTIFLRLLVQGHITLLYAYDYLSRDHFFVQKGHDTLQELHYKEYLSQEQYAMAIVGSNVYKAQLDKMLADCPASNNFLTRIKSLSFEERPIKKIIISYNNHFDTTANKNYKEQMHKNAAPFIVSAGLDISRLKINGTVYDFNNLSKSTWAAGYVFGVAIDAHLPGKLNSWSVYNELNIRNYSNKLVFDNQDAFGQTYPEYVNLSILYLSYQLSFRYTSHKGHIRPFIEVGVVNGLIISQKYSISNNQSEINDIFSPSQNRHHQEGYEVGGGVCISKFFVGLRAEVSNGFSQDPNVSTAYKSLILTTGYSF